ncbi:MAG: HlyD family type I secretion periplasmic adaptor subunit [Methylotenera sp.]|nr:HlyD family type I secretion periplasmic adaptor subunit [Methylotenera sp.]
MTQATPVMQPLRQKIKEIGNDQPSFNLDHFNFSPGILGVQERPPSPLPRMVLRGVLLLLLVMLIWAIFGRLDVVSVAEGKLVPVSYIKIVQPSEAGIVREIAIKEGQAVSKDQVLIRMDANLSEADSKALQSSLQHKSLELRRIEAELANQPLKRKPNDDNELFNRIYASYQSNRRAYEDDIATEKASLQKAYSDLSATQEIQHKLEQTLPSYQAQEAAYNKLVKDGFAGKLMGQEKQRERIEAEQDLRAQEFNAKSLQASIAQSQKRLNQIQSAYRQKLETERVTTYAEYLRLEQEWAKQSHKNSLLELKAPQAGIVKDLATHTPGTVVSPGTVLMTLVPNNEALQAEVWLKNEDAGFVRQNQAVKVKLSAYPFQKYGMVDGKVLQVSADATDKSATNGNQNGTDNTQATSGSTTQLAYRTIIQLSKQSLEIEQDKLHLAPGMQVVAEIKLADQTVMEYLLSPISKAFHEAGRER